MKNSYADDFMKTGEFALDSSAKKSIKENILPSADKKQSADITVKQKLGG